MRPCKITLSTTALRDNFAQLKQKAPHAKFWSVVKANAYGHGLSDVAAVLAPYTEGFAVATFEEAAQLRGEGIEHPILLLEGLFSPEEAKDAKALNVHLVVHQPLQLDWLAQFPDTPWQLWLKLDTGMHRLGVPTQAFGPFFQAVKASLPYAKLHAMSHLSCADEPKDAMTLKQLEVFNQLTDPLGIPRSLANSAALIRYPQTHFDWVRPGIALYGATELLDTLKPVMTFQSEVIARKTVPAGACVGYGCAWQALVPRQIAVVAAGYGDGYPREVQQAQVWIAGAFAPVVGRVSMDMLTIDVTEHPRQADIRPGTPVELWGEHIPIMQVAKWANTIPYTLLCGIHQRVHREKTS